MFLRGTTMIHQQSSDHIYNHIAYLFIDFLAGQLEKADPFELKRKDDAFFVKVAGKDKSIEESIKIYPDEQVIFIDWYLVIRFISPMKVGNIDLIPFFEDEISSERAEELLTFLKRSIDSRGVLDSFKRNKNDVFEIKFLNIGDKLRLTEIVNAHNNKIVRICGVPIIRAKELAHYPLEKKWACAECGVAFTQVIEDRRRETKKYEGTCENFIPNEKNPEKGFKCGSKKWNSGGVTKYLEVFSMTIESLPEDTKDKLDPSTFRLEFVSGLSHETFVQSLLMFYPYEFNGIVKLVEIKKQEQSSYLTYLEVMSFQLLKPMKSKIELSDSRREELKKFLQQKDSLDIMAKKFGTRAVGFDREKKAFILMKVLQTHFNKNSVALKPRDYILHMLLCGDYGRGKSELAECFQDICDNPYYITASTTTGVGLSGSVVKDEVTGQSSVQAGAYAKASGDTLVIEEFDKKRDKSDMGVLNEGMSKFVYTIAKANQYRKFKANTMVIMIANPIYSSFNLNKSIFPQINIDGSLLSRFAFISPIVKPKESEAEKKILKTIIEQRESKIKNDDLESARMIRECIEVASETFVKIAQDKTLNEEINKLCEIITALQQNQEVENVEFFRHWTPRNYAYLTAVVHAVCMWHCHTNVTIDDYKEAKDLYFSFMSEFREYPTLLNLFELKMGASLTDHLIAIRGHSSENIGGKSTQDIEKLSNRERILIFIGEKQDLQEAGAVDFSTIEEFATKELGMNVFQFEHLFDTMHRSGEIMENQRQKYRVVGLSTFGRN
jgi:DNA replicative helicase MCM subunit Mcm2 (Cdc46/Mcm family)